MKTLTIQKYKIAPWKNVLSLPASARILTVRSEHKETWDYELQAHLKEDEAFVWVMLDPNEERIPRTFYLWPTDKDFQVEDPDMLVYVGTFQLGDSVKMVFHVFTNRVFTSKLIGQPGVQG